MVGSGGGVAGPFDVDACMAPLLGAATHPSAISQSACSVGSSTSRPPNACALVGGKWSCSAAKATCTRDRSGGCATRSQQTDSMDLGERGGKPG